MKQYQKRSILSSGIEFKKDSWLDVFSMSLGKILANQLVCSELVVKDQDWQVDFDAGTISFGQDEYQLQFIGSESSESNTWLWGWENINGFPKEVILLAEQMKVIAEEWRLKPMQSAEFDLTDGLNGYHMAIVTAALSEDSVCFYRGLHVGGAVFIAFSPETREVFAPVDIERFVSTAMQCVQEFSVNHELFIQSFLFQNEIEYEWEDQSIIAHFDQDLQIDFDQQKRIENFTVLNER